MIEPPARMSLERMLLNGHTLEEIERHIRRWAIVKVMQEEDGHQGRTATRLGIHRNTLLRQVRNLGITVHYTQQHRRKPVQRAVQWEQMLDPPIGRAG